MPFFRGTLDLLGIVPRFDHREEYKTAMNSLTETSDDRCRSARRSQALLDSIDGQIVDGIAADRKLDAGRGARARSIAARCWPRRRSTRISSITSAIATRRWRAPARAPARGAELVPLTTLSRPAPAGRIASGADDRADLRARA